MLTEIYILIIILSFNISDGLLYILQIWDAVSKPQAHKNTPFDEFFNVIYYLSDWFLCSMFSW